TFDQVVRIHCEADFFHGFDESALPSHGRLQYQRTGNKRDAFMTKRREVLNGLANAMLIVDADIADSRKRRPDVDEDEGDLASFQIVEERLFHTERYDGNAFDAALDHPANGERDSLGIVDRGSGEDFVVVLDGDVFESLNDFREERVGNL